MRWPIRLQLLFPTLSVVLAAIALTALAGAYYGSAQARQQEKENLRRVVATLAKARYPLSEVVLLSMRGLSGAEFVHLDARGDVLAGTVRLDQQELEFFRSLPSSAPSGDLASSPSVTLAQGGVYLAQSVTVAARDPLGRESRLIVLYPEARRFAASHEAAWPALAAGALSALAVVLVTTWLAHRFVRPIQQLGLAAARIAEGDFQTVPVTRRDDEFRDLALALGRMSEKLAQFEAEVRRNEQLRTLDQLGAGMAHQLRNAAAGGRLAIELHQRACAAGDGEETLEIALRQLRLMESYLQRFLELGKTRPAAHAAVDLGALVADALTLIEPACAHAGVRADFRRPDAPLWISGDAEALRQVIVNLAMNALDAVGGLDGRRGIAVALDRGAAGEAVLRVTDTGPGPPPELVRRLFEPFVTGKPEGTGLGLYVARQVVAAHRGTIAFRREEGATVFEVAIPQPPPAKAS